MATNPLDPKKDNSTMPGLITSATDDLDLDEWAYRVGYFLINGPGSDDVSSLESLMTRSIRGNVIIVETKSALSAESGQYVNVVTYLERRHGDA